MKDARLLLPAFLSVVAVSMADARAVAFVSPSDAVHAVTNSIVGMNESSEHFKLSPYYASNLNGPIHELKYHVSSVSDIEASSPSGDRRSGRNRFAANSSFAAVSVGAPVSNAKTAAISGGDAWMMVFVAVGLVAAQLRRKQKSLQHPLAV